MHREGYEVVVIPTAQQSKYDLAEWGDDVAKEKDFLLEVFVEWASILRAELQKRDIWCDYVDPCSGLLVSCTLSTITLI